MTQVLDRSQPPSAVDLGFAFRSGHLRPSDLAERLLARIEARREDNCYITVTAERAMAEARAADARFAAGMPLSWLDGVPIAWKDLFDMRDTATTAGSQAISRSGQDARVVRHLGAAGMVTLGKLNTSEFAYSGLGLNPHFGTPRNPNDQARLRSPGGSSSGSGAAVAAGLTCCAIGTDTGGSIRVPASFNGVVGLKTSTGRVDRSGMFLLSRSFDTIGPLAQSVEDCALLFHHLLGGGLRLIARRDLAEVELLCPTNIVLEGLEPAVAENFHAALERLARRGVRIRHEDVPALRGVAELRERHGTLIAAEAYAEHLDLVESPEGQSIDRRVMHRILGGKTMRAADVILLQHRHVELRQDLAQQMGRALLVMPTTPNTAPVVAPLEADDQLFHKVNTLSLRNVSLCNPLELCSLAIPSGRDGEGMPTSLMLCALHGGDENLLAQGMALEPLVRNR